MTGAEQAKELIDRLTPNAPNVTQHPMVVATNTPNLTVYLDGDTSNAVQAISLTGVTLTVGASGVAYWAPPLPPIVFLTADDDSGWVNLTYEAGFSSANGGQLAYRRTGKIVFLRGGANRDAGNYSTTAEDVAIIPATDVTGHDLRPPQTQRFANYGTGGRLGRVQIDTAGAISIAAPNLISSTDEVFGWLGLSHVYLLT